MTTFHEQIPEFDNRNNFLWFLLGLASVANALVEELKPGGDLAVRVVAAEGEPQQRGRSDSLLR
jgi:hypothetical protein